MKNILLVDDTALILGLLANSLKDIEGINILKATNLTDAKHIMKEHKIHVAVLDINLPDGKYGEVVDIANVYSIPSIVFTGSMNESLKAAIMEKDILEFVLKSDMSSVTYIKNTILRVLSNYDKKVIVADDSRAMRSVVVSYLQKMNIKAYQAADGLEAIALVEKYKEEISLIITDYNMPHMDGLELVLKVRETYKKDQLAIIVLSDVTDSKIASKFLRFGANDFLNKPFSYEELLVRVNSNLELLDLFHQTRELSNKDFLTATYNRRYFYDTTKPMIAKAKRKKYDVAMVMIDIDNFKRINDTYGHAIGDEAIKEVVRVIDNHIRETDLLARFGGEEFCIFVEEISKEDVYIYCRQFKK